MGHVLEHKRGYVMPLPKDDQGKYPSYACPGGYPLFYIMGDGETLCPDCANGKNGSVAAEITNVKDWKMVAVDVNWEDPNMHCCHYNKHIESAYGND